jgi:Zn-dependent peptidase ImmA (M78 family)
MISTTFYTKKQFFIFKLAIITKRTDPMEGMLDLAEREHIKIDYYSFENPLKGIYYVEEGMPPVIGLDYSLKNNLPLLRSVMAEELGHHFTSVGNCIPREFYNYSARQYINKAEYKALRWAANYLIPDSLLLDAFHDCIDTAAELAEHFMVTPEIVNLRLKLFAKPVY